MALVAVRMALIPCGRYVKPRLAMRVFAKCICRVNNWDIYSLEVEELWEDSESQVSCLSDTIRSDAVMGPVTQLKTGRVRKWTPPHPAIIQREGCSKDPHNADNSQWFVDCTPTLRVSLSIVNKTSG